MARDEWVARLDQAERQMINDVLGRLEAYRVHRCRSVADIAAGARMSPRMSSYIRSRKGHLTIRQLIALCDAHGLAFSLPTRQKTQQPLLRVVLNADGTLKVIADRPFAADTTMRTLSTEIGTLIIRAIGEESRRLNQVDAAVGQTATVLTIADSREEETLCPEERHVR